MPLMVSGSPPISVAPLSAFQQELAERKGALFLGRLSVVICITDS